MSQWRKSVRNSNCQVTNPLLALRLQQFLLAFHAPAISGERSIGSYDAMARDDQRHAIQRAGTGHGTRRIGLAHFAGDIAITARFAARDLPQCLPHAKLEDRTAEVE